MGLLQQEFLPVLQPSIQTADRYHVEKHLLIVCRFVHMSYCPWFPALCSSVLFFMLALFF